MTAGKALLAAGALLLVVPRVVFGPPTPVISIVWSGVAPGVRPYLESKFSLRDRHQVAEDKWSYALADTSAANRRALATDSAVAGIEGIDRRTYALAGRLPRATWRHGWVRVPHLLARTVEVLALLAALAGMAIIWRPNAVAAAAALGRVAASSSAAWLQRGIPAARPEAAAAFRIVFGTLAAAFFVSERVYPELLTPLEVTRSSGAYGAAIRWLAEHPEVVELIRPALATTGVLFVLGVATRISFLVFTAAALMWSVVFTLNTSAHAVAALVMALFALLPARWGEAWSVDAWIRRRRGGHTLGPARAYGYAFWAPGLVLAVAFAAAAWSKIREGPGWILNGTVKYHFVSDLEHAWVSWGPALTRWHGAAVAMCLFAVLAEAGLITSMFSSSYGYRAALGFLAVLLLAGFAVFQGIVWLGWWLLLLAFLPWHLIGARHGETAARVRPAGVTAAQLAALCLVVIQQVVATAMHLEARPLFSTYDMYSTTYATAEDYEAASNLVYRVVAVADGRSSDLPGCVVDDTVAEIARRALEGSSDDLRLLRAAVGGCLRLTPGVRQVALEGDRQVFLWNESRFAWKRRLDVIGPIEADRLRE